MAQTDCRDRGADVLHRVVDREPRGDAAAGGVYVQGDGFGGVVGFEEEQLRYYGGGQDFFDFAVQADYALFQQAREDVAGLDAAGDGLGHEGRRARRVDLAMGSMVRVLCISVWLLMSGRLMGVWLCAT